MFKWYQRSAVKNIYIISNSMTVILFSCKRKKLILMKIVLKHCNLRETKNSLNVTDFYIKLAEELEVNFH